MQFPSSDIFAKGAGAIANKAVNYGNKWLNNKINYGLNYAENFVRQFDFLGMLPERWTILDDKGEKVLDFDAFHKTDISADAKIISAPVEGGSFVMYNKTRAPLELSCTLIKQGFPADLQAYVDQLLIYVDAVTLVSIVTPDKEYQNMNLTKVKFTRSAENGVDMIMAECNFQEVRQVTLQYTSAKLAQKTSRGRQQGKETSFLEMTGNAAGKVLRGFF